MKVTIEMIEELKKRKDVSYEKARKALEETDGDILDAIIYLEDREDSNQKENTILKSNDNESIFKKIVDYLRYDIAFKKGSVDQFSLPIWLFLIIFAFTRSLTIIAVIIAILNKYTIYVKKPS